MRFGCACMVVAGRIVVRSDAWELEACRCSCSPGEEPHLWARGGLAQARRARLSEKSQKPMFHCLSPRLGEKRLA